jgi:hypothetical protein
VLKAKLDPDEIRRQRLQQASKSRKDGKESRSDRRRGLTEQTSVSSVVSMMTTQSETENATHDATIPESQAPASNVSNAVKHVHSVLLHTTKTENNQICKKNMCHSCVVCPARSYKFYIHHSRVVVFQK